MAKVTARSTLAFDGEVIAKAGKEFDSKAVPAPVLKDWVTRGLCSPPPKAVSRRVADNEANAESNRQIKESKDGSDR